MKVTESLKWPEWPIYGQEERDAVDRVIRSNQIFADREVRKFEEQYADYIGCNYAAGLGNATQGLHLALAALGVGVGDEVIVTPYSWISSASCILMQNAIPIFCDIEGESFGLDPEKIEARISKRTKAIIVVHMFGYPARIIEIAAIAEKHGIPLIEDASHAHGARVGGVSIGKFGTVSVFSLHQRKSLSVGDGGVICTDHEAIHKKIHKLRSFGDNELSYNYRMTEFAGALGQVGLSKLENHNKIRRANAITLASLLEDTRQLRVHVARHDEYAVYYAVLIEIIEDVHNLDNRLTELQNLGIPIRKTWNPLHIHPHFNPIGNEPARGLPWKHPSYDGNQRGKKYSELDLPVTKRLCPDRVLELYVHPPTGYQEIKFAADNIKNIFA